MILMDPNYQNFNLLTFSIQHIPHIKIWLSCVVIHIICDGLTNNWNFNSDIIRLVPNNNPPEYKEHFIYFVLSVFGEYVTSIDWI